jgi:hypothetical protein
MSFNKISRARNLLNDARRSLGGVHLNPDRHYAVLSKIFGAYRALGEAIALLDEAPKPHDIARRPRAAMPARPPLTISKPQMFDMADHHLITRAEPRNHRRTI